MLFISRLVALLSTYRLSTYGVLAYFGHELNPQTFNEGDVVKLKVNKLTSVRNALPIGYYSLPFCQPESGKREEDDLNLGQLLVGDRIESSPYVLRMKQDMYCEQLCSVQLDTEGSSRTILEQVIRQQYHNNWIVDNLNAASRIEDDLHITTRYWQGFPVGFTDEITNKAYINNHVNIEIMYSTVNKSKYRIVRFLVQPFSIKYDYELKEDEGMKHTIIDPIESCRKNSSTHTDYEMVKKKPQEASGNVLFTYDVIWIENKNIQWASRWDIYTSMDEAIPDNVHWYSITNSVVVVCLIVFILIRFLRRDIIRYNKVNTDQTPLTEEINEYGWKMVHADVFRPPRFSPLFLAVLSGSGAQLLFMAICTIPFAASGLLHPARRGYFLIVEIALFVLMGSANGYVTARLYKSFHGNSRILATTFAALTMPGLAFGVFVTSNIVTVINRSSRVPIHTILVLMLLWFCVATPLVFLGAYVGYKQDTISFPVLASSIPREIPKQPWYLTVPVTLLLGAVLPFSAGYVELYYILSSIWFEYYYYEFRFFFLVLFVMLLTCAVMTALIMYFQLNREDHRWWWRSFCNAGSIGIYVFGYACIYFKDIEATNYETYVIYFGYMGLLSFALFCMMGFVGLCASLWLNQKIFTAIKID